MKTLFRIVVLTILGFLFLVIFALFLDLNKQIEIIKNNCKHTPNCSKLVNHCEYCNKYYTKKGQSK